MTGNERALARDTGGAALQEQIREFLSEGVAAAIERERTAFDILTAPFEHSLVLFGAGTIGRKTAAGLQSLGIAPLAFADNNSTLWGKRIDGVTVMSPQDAVARF